jgi:hypothetical protein
MTEHHPLSAALKTELEAVRAASAPERPAPPSVARLLGRKAFWILVVLEIGMFGSYAIEKFVLP